MMQIFQICFLFFKFYDIDWFVLFVQVINIIYFRMYLNLRWKPYVVTIDIENGLELGSLESNWKKKVHDDECINMRLKLPYKMKQFFNIKKTQCKDFFHEMREWEAQASIRSEPSFFPNSWCALKGHWLPLCDNS